MEIERILGTDKGKDAFYKADRNFVAIQADIQVKDTLLGNEVLGTTAQTVKGAINENKSAIDVIEGQLTQATYASVTKQEPVFSLGADAIQGQVPINVKGLSAVNLVKMDLTKWSSVGQTHTISSSIVTCVSAGNTVIPRDSYTVAPVAIPGRKYYVMAEVRVTNSSALSMLTRLVGSGGGTDTSKILNSPAINAWYKLAEVLTVPATSSGPLLLQICHTYVDNATSSGKAMQFKNILVVDLTALDLAIKTSLECDKMFPKYFDGLGSVNDAKIKSRGKNLFDINSTFIPQGATTVGTIDGNTLTVSGLWYVKYTVKVQPNTDYVISFNSSGTGLKQFSVYDTVDLQTSILGMGYTGRTFNSGKNSEITILFYTSAGTPDTAIFSNIQLEKGTVATAYELYAESISPLPDLRRLPSGVTDEIINGKFIKRMQEYTLRASDVSSSTSGTYTQYITIPLTAFVGLSPQTVSLADKSFIIQGFTTEIAGASVDSPLLEYNYRTTDTTLYLVVPLGTYTTLAAAQTALAGTKVIYQLAIPIVEDLVTPLTVFPKGTISIESDSETTIPELTLNYPINTAGAIEKLNDAVNQITKVMHEETQWITATLQNGWTGILRYRKNQIGLIELAWELTPGTVISGTVIAQLPSDYFPAGITALLSIKNTDASTVRGLVITADGKIVVRMTEITSGANYLGTAVLRGV